MYLSTDLQYIVWCIKDEQQGGGIEKKVRRLLIDDIVDISVGVNGSAVLKRHALNKELDHQFFSLKTAYRSLDLQANDT